MITGLDLFSADLIKLNNEMATGWKARLLKFDSIRDIIAGVFNLAKASVWYTIGSPEPSRSMSIAAKVLQKPHIMHWVGSDIEAARRNPDVLNKLRDISTKHLTEVEWEAEELRGIGVQAAIVPLPPRFAPCEALPPLPEKFTLLVYLPRTRTEFYGKNEVVELIEHFRDRGIRFLIVGGGSVGSNTNAQVENLGWQDSLADAYGRSSALLRLTPRDGLSLMVLEALAYGRHVLWTKSFPFVTRVGYLEDVIATIESLLAKHERRELQLQTEAAEFIRARYGREQCMSRIISAWNTSVGLAPMSPPLRRSGSFNGSREASLQADSRIRVSVIIRSKGDLARKDLLRRAVDSVLSQEGVDAELIVVLNGADYDPDMISWLKSDSRIRCVVLPAPDKPLATAVGRSLVTAEFFSYLDDDDEYLPGALAMRAKLLIANPDIDCLATNGDYIVGNTISPVCTRPESYSVDYADALLDVGNWMASCGATFRASTVSQKYFDNTTRHCEWTLIAFRIASNLNVTFINERTYRVYNTPESQSKTIASVNSRWEIFEDMMRWNKRPNIAWKIRRNRVYALHNACSYHRLNGNFSTAWKLHWKSLSAVYGLKFTPYTLLLLARSRTPINELLSKVGIGRYRRLTSSDEEATVNRLFKRQ